MFFFSKISFLFFNASISPTCLPERGGEWARERGREEERGGERGREGRKNESRQRAICFGAADLTRHHLKF